MGGSGESIGTGVVDGSLVSSPVGAVDVEFTPTGNVVDHDSVPGTCSNDPALVNPALVVSRFFEIVGKAIMLQMILSCVMVYGSLS